MPSLSRQRLRRWRLILKLGDERKTCDGWRQLAVELAIAAIYEQEVMGNRGTREMAEPKLDWEQVVLNGGPACFALLDDEKGWYCGRAERWDGHNYDHKFVSLETLTAALRAKTWERAIQIVSELPVQNAVPNFTRASTFKAEALSALNAAKNEF